MRAIAEATVALLDLLEVEVRTLRRGMVRAAMTIGLVAVGASLVVVAAGLLLTACYGLLVPALSAPGAAAITAVVAAGFAVAAIIGAQRMAP